LKHFSEDTLVSTRRLPIYLLVDCSESMAGEAIEDVSRGLDTMIQQLQSDPHALETAWLSVITFSRTAQQVVPLTELLDFRPPRLSVRTGTAMGAALRLLVNRLQNEVRRTTATTKGDFKPLVILLTDGQPTDDYQSAAQHIRSFRNPAIANIYAIGCGPDVDTDILREITEIVLQLRNMTPQAWQKLFVWLSASVSSTSAALETGGEGQPIHLPSLPDELELAPQSMGYKDPRPRQVFLHARCSRGGGPYLMRYARRPGGDSYVALCAHRLEQFEEDARYVLPPINSSLLEGVPACPYCGNPVAVACECGVLTCFSGDPRQPFQCPGCRRQGQLSSGAGGFDVRRASG
jgi:uncharacterized protein YegL